MGVFICDKRKLLFFVLLIYKSILFFSGKSKFKKKPYLKPTQVNWRNTLRCSK